jgi:hypothetical protein
MSVCLHPRFCYSAHKSQLSASRYIVIGCLSGLTVFSNIISQTARFLGKNTKHNMRVLIFSTNFSQTCLILRRIQRDIDINLHTSSRKELLFFSGCNET